YPVVNDKGEIWRVIEHIRDITDIKKTQDELIEIHEYFKAVLNAINDAVFIDEAETGKVIYVNRTACEMYGYGFDEMIHMSIEAISAGPPDYTQGKAIEQLLKSREEGPQLFEWYAKKASGELFWVEVNARFASIGEKSYFIVSVRDITQWKANVLSLKQSEEKYRQLVDQATEMLFLHDLEGNLIDVNQAAIRETGYQRDELLTMKVFDIDPDAHERGDIIRFWQAMKPDDHITIGVKHLRKDGTIYPAEVTMGLVLIGKETYVMALARDITERKQAEQEIVESRDKFQNMLNLAVDGILIGDTEGRITDANDYFCSMIGREKTNLIGKHIKEIPFTPESLDRKPFRFDLLQQSEILVSERELVNVSGEIITVEMRSKMMPDKTYQSIFRDITKRKLTENEVNRKNEELARLNAEKDQLMSIIGHDLRSPFTSFLGFTGMLTDPNLSLQEAKFREMASNMRKSALATFRLLENLLEWSRLQRGIMNPEKKQVKMAEIIDEAIESLEETSKNKMISISRPENDQLMVYADPMMLTTVVRNLLSNAIKFSYRNSTITIQLLVSGSKTLQILIIDQGMGMNEATQSVLFKVDPLKSMAGTEGERSTGLGLLICKQLIEMLEGNIRVISKLGRGSTFIVELPLNQ
ncbi:MAG: PAS domain S-box protein, partial [Bacteroidales bacterium]|nr:PAS domain S-box protein [Bacteroidales bacterium]